MIAQMFEGVHLLTVERVEGFEVAEYLGAVSATAIYGANFLKDFMAGLSDKLGGRARGYERALQAAVESSLKQVAGEAKSVGGNAILGLRIVTNVTGKGIMVATATGTAVRLKR